MSARGVYNSSMREQTDAICDDFKAKYLEVVSKPTEYHSSKFLRSDEKMVKIRTIVMEAHGLDAAMKNETQRIKDNRAITIDRR